MSAFLTAIDAEPGVPGMSQVGLQSALVTEKEDVHSARN